MGSEKSAKIKEVTAEVEAEKIKLEKVMEEEVKMTNSLAAMDAKIKEMATEAAAAKEKTDKLLEVLGKRGVQVRELRKFIDDKTQKEKEKDKQIAEKEASHKMVLKQK